MEKEYNNYVRVTIDELCRKGKIQHEASPTNLNNEEAAGTD